MVTIPSPFPPQTTSLFPKPPPLNYLSSSLPTLSPLKFKPNLKSKCLPSSSPLHHNDVDDDVIGDCLVFEEGAFDDPFLTGTTPISQDDADNNNDSHKTKKKKKKKNKGIGMEAIDRDNLVPEEWKEVQAEINITKKERRKIAQEIQFNSRVEKKKQGYLPISSVNLEEYKAYREAKLAQLNPIVLDQPASFKEEEEEDQGDEGSERVAPRNPRWAVYGKGFEDVKEFFQSGDYVPADNKSQGSRKLFTKEEKALLNKKVPDLTAATSNKWLPLHTLAASGEFYLMDALLKHNVDINAVDVDSLTALHKAIIGKKQAITSYLLRESANPFVLDEDGASLMHYAVQTASTPAIKLLLLYNVDINLQDKDGWTPLHLAVQARRTDIVKLLLIRGADKTIKNREGLTPLGLCLYSGRDTRTHELIKLLKQLPKKSKSLTIVSSHMVSTS